ncbi:unnamed protein product [Caenorhabditis brenneri]
MPSILSRLRSLFPRQQPFEEVLFSVLQNCENQSLLRKSRSYKNVRILVTIGGLGDANASVHYKDKVISISLKRANHRNAIGFLKTDRPLCWILFFHSDGPLGYQGAQAITDRLFRVLHPDTALQVNFLSNETIQRCCETFPNALRSSGIRIGKHSVTGEELEYVEEMFTNLRAFNPPINFPQAYAGLLEKYSRLEETGVNNFL